MFTGGWGRYLFCSTELPSEQLQAEVLCLVRGRFGVPVKTGKSNSEGQKGKFKWESLMSLVLSWYIWWRMSLQNPCSHHSHEDTYCWGNGSHVREITHFTDKERIILSVHVFPAYWHEGLDTLCQEPTPTCPQLAVSSALRCMKLCDALLRQHLFLLSMPLYLSVWHKAGVWIDKSIIAKAYFEQNCLSYNEGEHVGHMDPMATWAGSWILCCQMKDRLDKVTGINSSRYTGRYIEDG